MGCGCGKNKLNNRNSSPTNKGALVARPNTTARPINNNNSLQARNNGRFASNKLNNAGISAQQRKTEQIRRNAILRNLGKKN